MADNCRALVWARRFVLAAAWIVPARLRADWREEWDAELTAWAADGKPHGARHALGAFADAAWLRQRQVADVSWLDDARHGW